MTAPKILGFVVGLLAGLVSAVILTAMTIQAINNMFDPVYDRTEHGYTSIRTIRAETSRGTSREPQPFVRATEDEFTARDSLQPVNPNNGQVTRHAYSMQGNTRTIQGTSPSLQGR